MKKENIIETKSYQFAIDIVKACQKLTEKNREFILSKQLIRSGTSIGANVKEAEHAVADYKKLNNSYEELISILVRIVVTTKKSLGRLA
jgi:hypothetical protein